VTASFCPTEGQIKALINALGQEEAQLIDKEHVLAVRAANASWLP
jgi:hypothetical protein